MIIYLSISLNMCLGCSKEPSHLDDSFEYPQHMSWLRNKNVKNIQLRLLIWGPELYFNCVLAVVLVLMFCASSSRYPGLVCGL